MCYTAFCARRSGQSVPLTRSKEKEQDFEFRSLLSGGDIRQFSEDFIFVHDGAKSHTSEYTKEWVLANVDGGNWIPKDGWLSKSPDLNPCDFSLHLTVSKQED